MVNLFTALKQGTHASHEKLENTYPFTMYHGDSVFDFGVYQHVLTVMYRFHACVSQSLMNTSASNDTIAALAKHIDHSSVLDAIQTDVVQVQAIENKKDEQPLLSLLAEQTPEDLPSFNSSTSCCIAGLYVWLGSSMGANIIVRRLSSKKPSPPTDYYSAMAQCARSWVSFKQDVDALVPLLLEENSQAIEHIVEDANLWFSYLISLGTSQNTVNSPLVVES
jgi:heme oxygenase